MNISLQKTFSCGQCFTVHEQGGIWSGVMGGRLFRAGVAGLLCPPEEEAHWSRVLALDMDYSAILAELLDACIPEARQTLAEAFSCGEGLRVLRQDGWEMLCTFILSQNNNLPRITGLVDTLSRTLGRPLGGGGGVGMGGEKYFAFPSPEAILDAGESGLRALRVGFRAPYLIDAAARVVDGRLPLDGLAEEPNTAACLDALCAVHGVGVKVASCTLLFGFGRWEVFPIDVWMRRVLDTCFPAGFVWESLGRYAGIAQQYLFYWARLVEVGK